MTTSIVRFYCIIGVTCLSLLDHLVARSDDGQPKLRLRSFHEFMAPGLGLNSYSVPKSDGSDLAPANLYGNIWADYEVFSNYRILYFQRQLFNLTDGATPTQFNLNATLLDPRFALRRTQLFDVIGMTTNYDLFFQPPINSDSIANGKIIDVGLRTNTNYALPRSRWSIGMTSEFQWSFYQDASKGSAYCGFFSPWGSYSITPKISTQHWFLIPFQHQKGRDWVELSWDAPTFNPIIQNGIGADISEQIWLSLMINHYLVDSPRVENTWMSLWVSMTIL